VIEPAETPGFGRFAPPDGAPRVLAAGLKMRGKHPDFLPEDKVSFTLNR